MTTPTRPDLRQLISRDTLTRTTGTAGSLLDTIVRALDSEITPPLAFSVTGTDRVVNIGNITVTNPSTNLNRSVPPISNLLPSFVSGTVTMSATGAGTATPSVGTAISLGMIANRFMRIGVSIDPLGSLTLTKGLQAATLSAATTPAVPSGLFGIGQVVVRTDASNNVANVLTSDLYQYVGGGGGSGNGDANSILETLKNQLVDSSYQNVTPSIASQQTDTLISAFGGGASYSIADNTYIFPTAGDSITSVQMLDEQEFLNDSPTDITKSLVYLSWKEALIDPSAIVQISRNGGTNYSTLVMNRVGVNTDAFVGEYEWTREEEDNIAFNTFTDASSANIELTNAAGVIESAGSSFTLGVNEGVKIRIDYVTVNIRRVGSAVGNYRYAIFTDSSGSPGVRLLTGAWRSIAAQTTSYAGVTESFTNNGFYLDDNATYHVVVETDDTYKASYVAATTALQVERSSGVGSGASTLDGTTWAAIASAQVKRAIGYYYQRFTSLITDTSGSGFNQTLDNTTSKAISLKFSVAAGTTRVVSRVTLPVFKSSSPSGTYFLKIVKDSAGVPSTAVADLMGVSVSKNAADAPNADVKIAFSNIVIGPGTYHVVFETDATYKANVGSGTIAWGGYTGASVSTAGSFDGTTWTASPGFFAATTHLKHTIEGRPLDLRVKITSATNAVQLNAFAAFYEISTPVAHGTKNFDKKLFKSQTDNLNSFAINFVPDVDLLRVYRIGTGQVFKYPDFTFSGSTIVFPVNTFYDSPDKDVELHFVQTEGSGFDGSDRNALLLASNFLGSTDSSLDRSAAGRGIFLRRPDGTLREIAIDDNDNIVVYTI